MTKDENIAMPRKPLTDEEIADIILRSQITLLNYCCIDKQTEFARAIEKAHGIGQLFPSPLVTPRGSLGEDV